MITKTHKRSKRSKMLRESNKPDILQKTLEGSVEGA